MWSNFVWIVISATNKILCSWSLRWGGTPGTKSWRRGLRHQFGDCLVQLCFWLLIDQVNLLSFQSRHVSHISSSLVHQDALKWGQRLSCKKLVVRTLLFSSWSTCLYIYSFKNTRYRFCKALGVLYENLLGIWHWRIGSHLVCCTEPLFLEQRLLFN
jgi:hypothetical protein